MRVLLLSIFFAHLLLVPASAVDHDMIEAPGPHGPLKGTFLSPVGENIPLVLIIPGSGPTDRDGNSPLGIKASTYRLIAEGLKENGIASVRFDKRGMFASAAAVPDANAVTIDDYANDILLWIAAARQRTGNRCVWVLGHSEGGLVAEAVAPRAPDVCGVVLVSAAGRPIGEVLRAQLNANPANAPVLNQAMTAIDKLEAGQRVDVSGLHPALRALFSPQVQGFLISEFKLDPAELLRHIEKPVLIIQGERDLQIDVINAKLLGEANPRAQVVLLPGVNHVLKSVPFENRAMNLATYADPLLPLAPGVVQAIVKFVSEGSKNGR